MAYKVCIFPTCPLAYVELYGRVDRSNLFDVLRSLREEGWETHFTVLCDATGIRELVLRPGELERFVEMLNEPTSGQEHGTVAVVVQRPLDYQAATLYKELTAQHGFRVAVCWSRKKAYAELGLGGVAEAIERELQQP